MVLACSRLLRITTAIHIEPFTPSNLRAGWFVPHVFQKKSKHGIAMPKGDRETIETRLKAAKDYEP